MSKYLGSCHCGGVRFEVDTDQPLGIYTHHVMRGETTTVGLNMACLEGFDVLALGDVPVGDGRNEWSLVGEGRGQGDSRGR